MTEARAPGWDCHVHVFDDRAPVQASHYRPVAQPLARIQALAQAHGIGHLVLVQPSVYGHDHGLLCEALAEGAGRHRGVAVLPPQVSERQLDRLHAAGVRGHRFNLVSPVGHAGFPDEALHALAPRLAERGWHLQWYLAAPQLPRLAAAQQALQRRGGAVPPFVLDHLAGLQAGWPLPGAGAGAGADAAAGAGPAGAAVTDPATAAACWAALHALADAGAWIKLSGWYRLGAQAPYRTLQPLIQAVRARFGPRCVWGSDWPHTSFDPQRLPAYDSLLAPLLEALHRPAPPPVTPPGSPAPQAPEDPAWQAVLTTQAQALYHPA